MAYSGAYKEDRAKALVGVVAVHVLLAAVILTGLNVRNVQHVVETLKTFDIKEIVPPPPPPPPQPRADRAKEEEGAAGKKAKPSPVVAPKPQIVLPAKPPVVAAPVAGTGNARTAGAATSGTGTGAGGSGRGGGGSGDFSGFTPARLIRNLSHGDYRQLTDGRIPVGRAMVALTVDTNGRPTNCRIARSSGDGAVDAGLCPLVTRRLAFRPAMDAQGRPIPYSLNYVAEWSL